MKDYELIKTLSAGDVCSQEIFYHKNEIKHCLPDFHRRHSEMIKKARNKETDSEVEWLKPVAFNKVKYYMIQKEIDEPKTIFKVGDYIVSC